MHQISETPIHPYHGHIQLVKTLITYTLQPTGSGSTRNLVIVRETDGQLLYDKNSISKFLSKRHGIDD